MRAPPRLVTPRRPHPGSHHTPHLTRRSPIPLPLGRYQQDLELHKRVLAWQQRIEPLLAHETTRHEFEIKYYQAGLLESFSGVETSQKKKRAKHDGSADADVLPFGEVAGAPEQFEVCRNFLAALMLVNEGNFAIHTEGNVDDGNLTFDLTCLHKELKTFDCEGALE